MDLIEVITYLPVLILSIADTSANLIFESEDVAGQALRSLSISFNGDLPNSLQLRTAKSMSAHPSTELQVRMATATDRKPPRAHERSRFYMMHPEHDPREQRRVDSRTRNNGDRKGRLARRRRSIERNHFDESMYDDGSAAVARRGRLSRSSFSSGSMRNTSHSRGRSRSASPGRNNRRNARRRTPPPRRSGADTRAMAKSENVGKELFPNGASANKTAAANIKKELFPHLKAGISALHRRNNSIDATHDPTSDVLSAKLSSKMVTPLVDGANDAFPLRSDSIEQKSSGFSIKGAAAVPQDKGFSIRGAAEQKVKELFPSKVNNKGKELFANRTRNRADMFY